MPKVPKPRDPEAGRGRPFEITIGARSRIVDGMLKVANVQSTHEPDIGFQIHCDEPSSYGGRDLHPQPLHYFAAALGFCLLTQLQRFAEMFDIELAEATCDVEFDWVRTGSVRAGTVQADAEACRALVSIQSSAEEDDLHNLVALAERGCFVDQLVGSAIPIETSYQINGHVRLGGVG